MPQPSGWSIGGSWNWEDTYRDLRAVAAEHAPMADEVDRLATAAYLTGRDEQGFLLWERAHRACLDAGDIPGAAGFGVRLAACLGFKGDLARARGWVDRTRHLLDQAQVECVEQGYLDHAAATCRILETGDVAGAHAGFVRAMKTSVRFEDRELATLARIGLGRCLIYLGEVSEGLAQLDEAMVAVESHEISPVAVGDCYCTVLDACRELFDVRRLEAWTASFARWFRSQTGLAVYGGHCSLHRAELLLLRGSWGTALAEAEQAIRGLTEPRNLSALGGAYYVRAELERLLGEFQAADDDYRRAHQHGCEPHPGLALLRLAQGRTDVAEASIRRLEAEAQGAVFRGRMLGAFAEIVLAAGDEVAAGAAADELVAVAQECGSSYLTAMACHARGAVLFAAGEARQALLLLRRAGRLWSDLGTPYEGARTRVLLAQACRALGDRETAELELDAAHGTFLQLGARPDAAEIERARNPAPARAPGALSAREVEVLIRISRGSTNRAIARDLVISERTVASHISHIFTKLGLTSRAAATAYVYEHRLLDQGSDAVHRR
jgi:DNA-binding CsgD family transcriptional regulator/tetratricopeptide (TPR) repeat protein